VLLAVLERALPARAGLEILDVGCGTGTMLGHLARFGHAQGIDADAEAIRFCRERGVEAVRRVPPGTPLPFADGTFDLVTALDVVEHIDDDAAAVAQMARVLRPGGLALLTVPAFPSLWGRQDEIAHHKRRYRASRLRALVTGAGLELVHHSHFNTLLFPPIAAVRLARRMRKRGRTPSSHELRSDFELTRPGRLNALLARVFAAEAPLVARGRLPFGVSLLALARKAYSPQP
jgi:SAM-dependent methyltransferase